MYCQIQVIVSGKLRAQRAKSMKFKDGYMISSGHPVNLYIDSAVRHVLLRQVFFKFLGMFENFPLPLLMISYECNLLLLIIEISNANVMRCYK